MLERLKTLLDRLHKGNMKLKLSKCKFSYLQIEYLGYRISEKGILPDGKKLEAVTQIEPPKTARQLKSFLGLVSYYRKFILNCAQIMQPLTNLLKKNVKFVWEDVHQVAFDTLKAKLLQPPLLQHPDFARPFYLQTDASYEGIGAILCKRDEQGREHPVAYASRVLHGCEKNYSVSELETLAVVEFVKYFRPYLYEHAVTVETDHTAVKAVLQKPNPSPRIARWGLALADVQLTLVPRKGSTNQNADCLSRLPNRHENCFYDIDALCFRNVCAVQSSNGNKFDWNKFQVNDDKLREIIDSIDLPQYKDLVMENGTLFKVVHGENKIVVPICLVNLILEAYHDDPLAGHYSGKKTYLLICQKYFLEWDEEGYLFIL